MVIILEFIATALAWLIVHGLLILIFDGRNLFRKNR